MGVNVEHHLKGMVMRCSSCGQFIAVEEPVEARKFFASLKAFIYAHDNCRAEEPLHGPS